MNKTQNVEGFFYHDRDALTRNTANIVISLIKEKFGAFNKVIDIGCGVGTWLSVASENGSSIIHGIEGPWLDMTQNLVIDKQLFDLIDLESEWRITSDFDLGICLEVAEHLTSKSGARLIKNISNACNLVVFSAAIPGQGGNGHINEQWPVFWQNLFSLYDMEAIDCIRPVIIGNSQIPLWYRQNIVLFANREVSQKYYKKLYENPSSRYYPVIGYRVGDNNAAICNTNITEKPLLKYASNNKSIFKRVIFQIKFILSRVIRIVFTKMD